MANGSSYRGGGHHPDTARGGGADSRAQRRVAASDSRADSRQQQRRNGERRREDGGGRNNYDRRQDGRGGNRSRSARRWSPRDTRRRGAQDWSPARDDRSKRDDRGGGREAGRDGRARQYEAQQPPRDIRGGAHQPASYDCQNSQGPRSGIPPASNGDLAQRKHGGASKREARSSSGRSSSEYSSGSDSRGSSDDGEAKKDKKDGGDTDKDEIVHFAWQKGQLLNNRYQLSKLLGDGTFGRVVLASDKREDDRQVAIKIIRDVKRYMENAKIEADILKDIRRADPQGQLSRSAIMYDVFTHDTKFYCLVFEPLGVSLYDFLKKNGFRGFFMEDIQSFSQQALEALMFLHSNLQMTHTDLKPENILLASMAPASAVDFPREAEWREQRRSPKERNTTYYRPANAHIKLIDFGNATYADEHHSSIINTRQYRGPEVILSLGWNERSDIWSIGCILMELYTGELLFGTHENLEHLALMERIVRPLPGPMLSQANKSCKEKYLTQEEGRDGSWRLSWPERASSMSSQRHVRSQRVLPEMTPDRHSRFAELVGHLLTPLPLDRPSAQQALKHKFFGERYSD